jgi:hypothetical protein
MPREHVRHRFHFLDPVGTDENLARLWLVPSARHVCELSHFSYFRDVCFLPCHAVTGRGKAKNTETLLRLPPGKS